MNYHIVKPQNLFMVLALMFLITTACQEPESTPEPLAAANVQVFVFPGETEKRLISEEKIVQNNCDGAAETSQTLTRQQTVQYTIEVGAGLTVSAEGKVGVPSVGEVGVGAEVATHYRVGYGRQETVSRSVTVATPAGYHIQHTIQQFEVWETGELLIIAGEQNQRLPYSFRRDFSIEAVAPANLSCQSTPVFQPTSSPNQTIVAPTDDSPTIAISDCSDNLVQDRWFGTDGAISHSYGFPMSDTAWGATADPAQSAMDIALAFGPYINLAPGQYKAVYRIKISGNESPNTPVVRLNIGAYVNGVDNPNLANRTISFGEVVNLGAFVDYEVRFVLSDCSTAVEFRAYYQNAGDIAPDSITLIKE